MVLRLGARVALVVAKKPAMPTFAGNTDATVAPCLRYRDAPAAIDWLCATFGFETHAMYPNPDGTIAHAILDPGFAGLALFGRREVEQVSALPTRGQAVERLP